MNATAPATDEQTGAKLLFEEHQHHGYMLLTIDAEAITAKVILLGSAKGIYKDPGPVDTFRYSAKLITLPDNVVVSL